MLSDICWHGHLRVLQGGGRLQVMQETPSLAGNRPSETAGVVTTTPPQEGSELQEQARRPWGLVWDHHPHGTSSSFQPPQRPCSLPVAASPVHTLTRAYPSSSWPHYLESTSDRSCLPTASAPMWPHGGGLGVC